MLLETYFIFPVPCRGWRDRVRFGIESVAPICEEVAGRGLFFVVRGMERRLSPGGLRLAFWPVAAMMAAVDCWGDHRARSKGTPLGEPKFSFWRMRCWFHLNRVLEFIPDRMGSAKWLARCRFEGMAHVEEARREGRPVVLAFVHAGPFSIARNWLRGRVVFLDEIGEANDFLQAKLLAFLHDFNVRPRGVGRRSIALPSSLPPV